MRVFALLILAAASCAATKKPAAAQPLALAGSFRCVCWGWIKARHTVSLAPSHTCAILLHCPLFSQPLLSPFFVPLLS